MSERVDQPSYDLMQAYEDEPCFLCLWTSPSFACGCGHISLLLPDYVYISFWPKAGVGCFDIKYYTCESKYYKDIMEEIEEKRYPDKIVIIYNLDVNAIKLWWNSFKEDANYDLWTQNCAIVVLKALQQGHSWFQEANFDKIKTPSDVFDLVKEKFNQGKIASLNTTIFAKYVLLCCTTHSLRKSYFVHTRITVPVLHASYKWVSSTVNRGSNLISAAYISLSDHISVKLLERSNIKAVAPRTVKEVSEIDSETDNSQPVQNLQPPNLFHTSMSQTLTEKKSLVTQPMEGYEFTNTYSS